MAKTTSKNPQVGKITDEEERKKALSNTLGAIEKQFGKGAIMKLGENDRHECADHSLRLLWSWILRWASAACRADASSRSTGRNPPARPPWRCTWSPKAQKTGGTAAFIDAEHALDPVYAQGAGRGYRRAATSLSPTPASRRWKSADALVRSGAMDIIVIDSVAALVPQAEIEGDMGDSHVGLQARLMSQALRKLAGIDRQEPTASAIFINQLREKVGVMFGNPETTTGGQALKFYAIRPSGHPPRRTDQERRDVVVGNRTKIKVVKNKVAPPFKDLPSSIFSTARASRTRAPLLDLAVENDLIQKSGAWFNYGDARIGQGRENARQYLIDHPDLCDELEAMIREKLLAPKTEDAEPVEVEAVDDEEEDEQLSLDTDNYDDEP